MHKPSKTRVRQSFERAAPTYDGAAEIQRQICSQLLAALPHQAGPKRLLDAGCGTGYALRLLQARFPASEAIGLDLSPAMLRHITTPCRQIVGDLEHLPLAHGCVDLYWSSLALQWCELPKALAEARRVLGARGQIAIASLGPNTFHELRHAFAEVDKHQHTLDFHTPEEIGEFAHAAGFAAVDVKNCTKIAYYADFKKLLQAVKAIGANQIGDGRRTSLMSRSTFMRAEAASETLRTTSGLPLTYDVITLTAHS